MNSLESKLLAAAEKHYLKCSENFQPSSYPYTPCLSGCMLREICDAVHNYRLLYPRSTSWENSFQLTIRYRPDESGKAESYSWSFDSLLFPESRRDALRVLRKVANELEKKEKKE